MISAPISPDTPLSGHPEPRTRIRCTLAADGSRMHVQLFDGPNQVGEGVLTRHSDGLLRGRVSEYAGFWLVTGDTWRLVFHEPEEAYEREMQAVGEGAE